MLIPLHTDDGRFESPPSMAVILMTGANQGLGYEALKTLAKAKQHKLIVATRSQQKSNETIASIVRATGANRADFTPVVVDLTSDESIYAAAKIVESSFGFLDVLVNNAGINRSPNENSTLPGNYRAVFETNVFRKVVLARRESYRTDMAQVLSHGSRNIKQSFKTDMYPHVLS